MNLVLFYLYKIFLFKNFYKRYQVFLAFLTFQIPKQKFIFLKYSQLFIYISTFSFPSTHAMISFIIKGKQYQIVKQALRQQMKTAQNNQLDKKVFFHFQLIQTQIELPSWVQSQEFEIIHQYLILADNVRELSHDEKQKKISQYLYKNVLQNKNINTTKKLIQIMRVSDYLTLQKFQQYFIQKCVIQSSLKNQNCIIYLQQTHKKLKNSSSGTAQAWYNLLNACIDFISIHLLQIYLNQPQRIQKLHQKILGQILDRTIKHQMTVNKCKNQKSTNSININSQNEQSKSKQLLNANQNSDNNQHNDKQKQMVFSLLMKSKKVNSVDNLCCSLKSTLQHKKINKSMHAKLSWKLHDLHQITDRKVKNFKFLDLNWILQAVRVAPSNTLKIKLTLLPVEQDNTNYLNYQIGVFYSKLYWNIDRYVNNGSQFSGSQATNNSDTRQMSPIQLQKKQGQKPLQIHYICLKNPISIDIYQINQEFQSNLNNRKLELSIYCSIDQCYSFVMNYIINDYSKLRIDEKKISRQEIYVLIEGSKYKGKYSQAVWLIKYLTKNQIQIPLYLLQNIAYDKLPTYQTEFLKKLVRNDNTILDQVFGKKQINPRVLQIQSQINSLTNSKVSQNLQTRSNHSRNGSKGVRHRKIFGQSPQKTSNQKNINKVNPLQNNSATYFKNSSSNYINDQEQNKQLKWQDIENITNIKNYFYDKNSPYLRSLT